MKPRSINDDSASFRNWDCTFLIISIANSEYGIFFADFWDIDYL